MSDHLPDSLMRTLSPHLALGKSRLQTLAWLIIGLVNARTVNLSHLASQCSGDAQVKSSYRRLQRFFQYVSLEGDWVAPAVVKLLRVRSPWVLCLDRTNWKIGRTEVNILMLAIATRRMRLPLMWTVLDKAGTSNQEERIVLMRRHLALFGAGSIAWLLADREFNGETWIEFLLENKIVFAIRMKENLKVAFDDGRVFPLRSLLARTAGIRLLKNRPARLKTMDGNLGVPLRFAAKRIKDGKLLIVATNGPAGKALKAYRRRWRIECLFGDSKTRGFNMEDTRITNPDKLNTLSFSLQWFSTLLGNLVFHPGQGCVGRAVVVVGIGSHHLGQKAIRHAQTGQHGGVAVSEGIWTPPETQFRKTRFRMIASSVRLCGLG